MYYVQYLLLNWRQIKLKEDIEDDSYNDLLILEKKLQYLIDNGFIKPDELELLKQIINCKSLYILAKEVDKDYRTLTVFFQSITNKLAQSLGSVFTDDGYLAKICSSNNLTHEEVEKLRDYMSKPYRGE
jgi:hypothetical protein